MTNEEKILHLLEEQSETLGQVIKAQQEQAERLNKLQGDVSQMQEDVSGLKEDVSTLKEDVSGLKKHISQMHETIDEIREDTDITRSAANKLIEWAELTHDRVGKPVPEFPILQRMEG